MTEKTHNPDSRKFHRAKNRDKTLHIGVRFQSTVNHWTAGGVPECREKASYNENFRPPDRTCNML